MSSLLFITLYLSCLIAPGLAIHRLLGLKLDCYLTSLGLSYSIFTLSFIVSNHFSLSASTFFISFLLIIASSMAYLFISYFRFRREGEFSKTDTNYLRPMTGIALVSAIYQYLFGSFTEVPADLYAHLERYQAALVSIDANSLGRALGWKSLLFQNSDVFYYLIGGISWLAKLASQEALSAIDFVNRSLFLIAVFHFSYFIFKGSSKAALIAILSSLFVALHMGINVFAYIRYYTVAPTMLNMVMYLFAVLVFLSIVRHGTNSQTNLRTDVQTNFEITIGYLTIIAVCIAAAAIHIQELMFIVVMIATMSVIATLDSIYASMRGLGTISAEISKKQVVTISVLATSAFILLYVYSQLNLTRAPNAHWRLWEFAPSSGFMPSITTLNLKLQFPKVMTFWGLLVYLLFFLNFRRYRKNLFILAGMLSPIVTILNPFFIDLFLRHYNSTALWRFCYLIPIHFVAGDLFVHYFRTLRKSSEFNSKLKLGLKKSMVSLILIALIGLLLPIQNTWRGIHYSRFPTLGQTDEKLGQQYYQDLITNLESLDQRYAVLTDPMTGYMISAMTQHHSYRNKFFRDHRFKHFTLLDYSNNPLRKYRNHLLIINKREKKLSRIGRLSEHWSEKQWLKTESYYPPELLNHLRNHPNRFELLWSMNDIQVYKLL